MHPGLMVYSLGNCDRNFRYIIRCTGSSHTVRVSFKHWVQDNPVPEGVGQVILRQKKMFFSTCYFPQ